MTPLKSYPEVLFNGHSIPSLKCQSSQTLFKTIFSLVVIIASTSLLLRAFFFFKASSQFFFFLFPTKQQNLCDFISGKARPHYHLTWYLWPSSEAGPVISLFSHKGNNDPIGYMERSTHRLDQQFSTGGSSSHLSNWRNLITWAHLRKFCLSHWGQIATGIRWVHARDVTNYPTLLKTGHYNKEVSSLRQHHGQGWETLS